MWKKIERNFRTKRAHFRVGCFKSVAVAMTQGVFM